MLNYDFIFIGGGASTINFFSVTANDQNIKTHPLFEKYNIAIIDNIKNNNFLFDYHIEANNPLKNFINNSKGKYKLSLPSFNKEDLKSYPILDDVVSVFYSNWRNILKDQIKSSSGKWYFNKAISLNQNINNSWDVHLDNHKILTTNKAIIATGANQNHIFSNKIRNLYKHKLIHSDDFQKKDFINLIKKTKRIGIVGASHSAMSTIKFIQNINFQIEIILYYRNTPNINSISEFYKPIFLSIFDNNFNKSINNKKIKTVQITNINELESIIDNFNYFIEATGYKQNLILIYDKYGNNVKCSQKPNCNGEIYYYPNQEKLLKLNNLYGMGLLRPSYGRNPEIQEVLKRIPEGVALSGEVDVIYNSLFN